MKIRLKNIGIIKDSEIQLDGLTVITGQNNSGKTTVGKVLYSLIDAAAELFKKSESDKRRYIGKKLANVESVLRTASFIRALEKVEIEGLLDLYPVLGEIFDRGSRLIELLDRLSSKDVESFAQNLLEELKRLALESIDNNKMKEQIDEARIILEKLFDDLSKDPNLADYTRESINQTLRTEFASQIQPVSKRVNYSKIELMQDDSICFDFELADNKILDNGNPVFIIAPYKKAYFIDDPFILDEFRPQIFVWQDDEDNNSLLNTSRIITHSASLRSALRREKQISIFEETILNRDLSELRKQIAQVLPGEFEFNSDGDYYVQNGSKLKISNMAAGSKVFAILKLLLDKGEINASTMLILDEPEAHLHPSWQNKFAEIIVLLVKELNTNILLTTHSPNFMLAIDAYMRKYDISSKANFYQTKHLDDGFVEYQCVNDDLGQIYADFTKYFSEVKMLRDEFLEKQGGRE